jgi:hypothetical protein
VNDFAIYRQDRLGRVGGGVLCAVRDSLPSCRRKDLETGVEMLACELRPKNRKKILAAVYYRPPNSNLTYSKEIKRSLQLIAKKAKFDQILICGEFNLPDMDWSTGLPTTSEATIIISRRRFVTIFCGNWSISQRGMITFLT